MSLKTILGGLLGWLVMAGVLAKLLPLKGADPYILFAALALAGIVAAAVLVWWTQRQNASAGGESEGAPALAPDDELEQLLREAESKLAGATQIKRGARFGNLPVFLLLGPPGAGKTTVVERAGVEPELLAGQAFQDGQVAPTRIANLWFARQSVFVEPARAVLGEKKRWLNLIRRIQPGRLTATVNRGAQAPRAAVVLFDCERLQATATLVTDARELHQQLTEVSRQLGIALPVYVLFTKADRIRFFLDYMQSLTENEAKQLLGAALPIPAGEAGGAYEERQAARISEALQEIYRSLADHRLDSLRRQADAMPLPAGYEFPREFRKLRNSVVQFLVDVCRPSQLTAAPFLRGFYFTGVRPVTVEQVVAPVVEPVSRAEPMAGATGIFRPGQMRAARSAAPEYVSRRVPQWVFLQGFFPSVVLADDAGLAASGASVKVSFLRRALLITAAILALILLIGTTISFFNNRELETEVQGAAGGLSAAKAENGALPSLDALQRLDRLRLSLATIADYNRNGVPLSYRWGLYEGRSLQPQARAIYFARFRQLLLSPIQAGWVQKMTALPATPAPGDSYSDTYNPLKSYLITTSNHEKSTVMYLGPQLLHGWQKGRDIDPERVGLARKQFDFYTSELRIENPFAPYNDANSIANARHYLSGFAGIERVYRNILNEVEQRNPAINFNRGFPGSAAVVIDGYDVAGSYTKNGFAALSEAFKHADQYFTGEQWVLGDQTLSLGDRSKLEADMTARYQSEYIDAWRKYIRAARVVGYHGIPDAAAKLKQNTGPTSPLLGALCLASENTVVSPAISNAFATVHKVVAPGCTAGYIGGGNGDYMKSLASLQVALEQIGSQKLDQADPLVVNATASATAAKTSAIQVAQSLGLDQDGHLEVALQQFLEAPIKGTDPLLRVGPVAMNGKGASFCGSMQPVMAKYPFSAKAQQEATLVEVNDLFKPGDGALWKFYAETLSKGLTRTGDPIPGSGVNFTGRFLTFFRRMAAFSNAAYAGGGASPKLEFMLRAVPTSDIQSLHLTVDGTAADFPAGSTELQKFSWPGGAQGVNLSGVSKTSGSFTRPYEGLWAVFRFFDDANRTPPGGSGVYEWDQNFGAAQRTLFVIKFDLGMAGGAPPVFSRAYLNGLSCVSEVASGQ